MKFAPLVLAAFLVTASCVGCRAPAPAALPEANRAERAEGMSVSLLAWDDGHPDCGGVWVSPTRILTAAHCVEDNGKPATALGDLFRSLGISPPPELEEGGAVPWSPVGQAQPFHSSLGSLKWSSTVKKYDEARDLALLEYDGAYEHPFARVRLEPLRDGEELDVVGTTIGLEFSYSRCYVSSAKREKGEVQVSGPVYFGNSGGGAFDSRGRLVGIALHMKHGHGGDGVAPDISFFAGQETIREFLAEYEGWDR